MNFLFLMQLMLSASESLRQLTIVQRKCLFSDETIQQLPVYSYNACNLVCRAQAAIRMCGCRPYYYPFINGTSCSPSGLFCLGQKKWPKNVGTCGCQKTCVEIIYTQNSLKKINWWEFRDILEVLINWLIVKLYRAVDGGIPFTQKSSFRYEILAPRLRLRRDVLFSYEDLIVSFGGVAALFLGVNCWGASEMVYFCLESSIKFIYRKLF